MDFVRKNRWRVAAALVTALLVAPGGAAQAQDDMVLPGWDLFRTPDGTQIGVELADLGLDVGAAGLDGGLVKFTGVPLESYDFGEGPVGTGGADSIIRRAGSAHPEQPRVPIEVVSLLLVSSNTPEPYYVTLQSARKPGEQPLLAAEARPSVGYLDASFEGPNGGPMVSEFVVYYDVRRASPDGPIVLSGDTGNMLSTTVWQHEDVTGAVARRFCHHGQLHLHCVRFDANIPQIYRVNHLLNGIDTRNDFQAGDPIFE